MIQNSLNTVIKSRFEANIIKKMEFLISKYQKGLESKLFTELFAEEIKDMITEILELKALAVQHSSDVEPRIVDFLDDALNAFDQFMVDKDLAKLGDTLDKVNEILALLH